MHSMRDASCHFVICEELNICDVYFAKIVWPKHDAKEIPTYTDTM